MTNRHLTTEATTWMVGDVAIYLAPLGDGWEVEAIDMQGKVVAEAETFAARETAERYIHELTKDLS